MTLKNRLASIYDVFSRRSAPRGVGYPPDQISERVRHGILLLYRDLVSGRTEAQPYAAITNDHTQEFWDEMHNALEHLHRRPQLSKQQSRSAMEDAICFLLECKTEDFFDFIELSFKLDVTFRIMSNEKDVVDAINEVFRVENSPYQLTPMVKVHEPVPRNAGFPRAGVQVRTTAFPKVVRAEDEVTHAEALAPALSVLANPQFEAANREFREALDEYRKGHYGDSLTKCGSSFESVMKVLCTQNDWPFDPQQDTAIKLIQIIFANSHLDRFFEHPFILIATMRNRLSSSHGGGTSVRNVKRHVAQYAITSTAAAIVLLVHEVGR